MNSTLAERLQEALDGPPKRKAADLARHCKIAPPSVAGWLSGRSKSLTASNCLAACRFLGVMPDWLADGVGPKYPDRSKAKTPLYASETPGTYTTQPGALEPDIWTREALEIMTQLSAEDKRAVLANMKTYIQNLTLTPPGDGQALSVAV